MTDEFLARARHVVDCWRDDPVGHDDCAALASHIAAALREAREDCAAAVDLAADRLERCATVIDEECKSLPFNSAPVILIRKWAAETRAIRQSIGS